MLGQNMQMTRLGQVLGMRPDRVASAWRRVVWAGKSDKDSVNLLDGVVDSFIRELGRTLQGMPGSPWARTSGMLRLSRLRGAKGLEEEFSALRRCLLDAGVVLNATHAEREAIRHAIDEAARSALGSLAMLNGWPHPKTTPFGGVVVEIYERPSAQPVVDDDLDVDAADATDA